MPSHAVTSASPQKNTTAWPSSIRGVQLRWPGRAISSHRDVYDWCNACFAPRTIVSRDCLRERRGLPRGRARQTSHTDWVVVGRSVAHRRSAPHQLHVLRAERTRGKVCWVASWWQRCCCCSGEIGVSRRAPLPNAAASVATPVLHASAIAPTPPQSEVRELVATRRTFDQGRSSACAASCPFGGDRFVVEVHGIVGFAFAASHGRHGSDDRV